ncbi:MAG: gliding motility protein GldM, partial [Bacteroidaceae bacterium]|nr:gliding motility protein GldM [Bacteroidaceae bacterium]
LHTLVTNIDASDVRVNTLDAYVIPTSQNVVRGGRFSARIVMAAVDSTQRPDIYVGGKLVQTNNGWYEVPCPSTGDFTLNGYIETTDGSGDVVQRPFTQKYTVVDPVATVSATMMNVLYAGYDNPIEVSVPGVPANKVSARISNGNGTLTKSGKGYICRPAKIGQDVIIAVSAEQDGRVQSMGDYKFRVRQLPDPTPMIEYVDANGNTQRYRGGGAKLPKQSLMKADGIIAAIDDGLLNIGFKVISFEMITFDNMGNAMPEISEGALFSARQKATMNRLQRGKRFYISGVKAQGPDGVQRQLTSTLEVIIN